MHLEKLLAQFKLCQAEYDNLTNAMDALDQIRYKPLSAVEKYDATNKKAYISQKVGEEPIEPSGAIKLLVPVYLAKKKAYEQEYAAYIEH